MVVRVICGTARPVTEPGLAVTTVEAMTPTWTLFLAPRSLTQRAALRTHWTGTEATPSHAAHTRPSEGKARNAVLHPCKTIPKLSRSLLFPTFQGWAWGHWNALFPLHTHRSQNSHGARRPSGFHMEGAGGRSGLKAGAAASKPRKNQQLDGDGAEQETCGTDDGDRRGASVQWGLWRVT